MATLHKYSPLKILEGTIDYTDKENIPTSKQVWSPVGGLDPKTYDSLEDDYSSCIESLMYISAYLEASGYPTDVTSLNGKFTDLTFNEPTELVVNYAGDILTRLIRYSITVAGVTEPTLFSIVTDFDSKVWVDKGADYDDLIRGNTFFKNNSTNITAIANVGTLIIASGDKSIAALSIAHKLNSTDLSIVVINPPSVFLDSNSEDAHYWKKLNLYSNTAWKYQYPKLTKFSGNDTTLHDYNLSADPAFYFKRNLTYDYTPDNLGEYNSIYQYVENTIEDKIVNDCFNNLGLSLPETLTIPTAIADKFDARKAYYAGEFDMDTSLITNFKAVYYDPDNHIVGFTTSDDKLFIAISDETTEERPVTNQSSLVDINYKTNEYKLMTECDTDLRASITALMATLAITDAFNAEFFVYGFGHPIHSLLRDLDTKLPNLDYTKGSLYIEGLPSVTVGFTGFKNFTTGNVIMNNLWQDEIVNNKTTYDGVIDDIMVDNLYDVKLTALLEENAPCIHSVYAYDVTITA